MMVKTANNSEIQRRSSTAIGRWFPRVAHQHNEGRQCYLIQGRPLREDENLTKQCGSKSGGGKRTNVFGQSVTSGLNGAEWDHFQQRGRDKKKNDTLPAFGLQDVIPNEDDDANTTAQAIINVCAQFFNTSSDTNLPLYKWFNKAIVCKRTASTLEDSNDSLLLTNREGTIDITHRPK